MAEKNGKIKREHDSASVSKPAQLVVYIRTGPDGQCPLYATTGSAGCDLIAAADLILLPGESRLMPLDLVMALPPGVEAQVRPRSGLSLRTRLRIPNTPGTIDSDYRSPVGVLLENTFSQADLPWLILRDPQLATELCQPGRQTTWAAFLADGAAGCLAGSSLHQVRQALPSMAAISGQTLYLDEQGYPFGTLRITRGERIAQMVFSRYVQAQFVTCARPEDIGSDRGGGFGSTGI